VVVLVVVPAAAAAAAAVGARHPAKRTAVGCLLQRRAQVLQPCQQVLLRDRQLLIRTALPSCLRCCRERGAEPARPQEARIGCCRASRAGSACCCAGAGCNAAVCTGGRVVLQDKLQALQGFEASQPLLNRPGPWQRQLADAEVSEAPEGCQLCRGAEGGQGVRQQVAC
jgi:hypothetical protein